MLNGKAGREELNNYLYDKLLNLSKTKTKFNTKFYINKLNNSIHKMPIVMANDLISCNKPFDQYEEFDMFCLLEALEADKIPDYFTKIEISNYTEREYINELKLELPLKINAYQVDYDQWLGVISYDELIKWSNSHLIRYNLETQRIAKQITIGDGIAYIPTVNKSHKNKIKQAMSEKKYISDTLTFNVINGHTDYKDGQLVIDNLEYLDIIDGYHRYLAITELYAEGNKIDGNLEIRIVEYNTKKACNFIWQIEQKLKMNKVLINSFAPSTRENKIVDALNKTSAMKQQIANGKYIDISLLSAAIKATYLKSKIDISDAKIINSIKDTMELMIDNDGTLKNRVWLKNEIYLLVFVSPYIDLIVTPQDYLSFIHTNKVYDLNKQYKEFVELLKEEGVI